MDDFDWFDYWESPKGPQREQLTLCPQLTYCFGVLYLTEFVPTVCLPLPSCGIYQGCLSLFFFSSSSFFYSPLSPFLLFFFLFSFGTGINMHTFLRPAFLLTQPLCCVLGLQVCTTTPALVGGCRSLEALRITSVSSPFSRFTLTQTTPSKYLFFLALPASHKLLLQVG